MKFQNKFGMAAISLVAGIVILTVLLMGLGEMQIARAADVVGMGADVIEPSAPLRPIVIQSTKNDTSLPLRELVEQAPAPDLTQYDDDIPVGPDPVIYPDGTHDPSGVQNQLLGTSSMPLPIHNFEGIKNLENPVRLVPPDTNGDVGWDSTTNTKYYMQWPNISIAVWDVTDPENVQLVLGPAPGNTLFSGFGGPCEDTNSGDPIILFDQLANRWMGGQFVAVGPPYYQCIAVSQTADPTGAWNRYEYEWPNGFNDYPKFGVWPDGYYMSANQFTGANGAGVVAFERSEMLNGNPAQAVYFDISAASSSYTSLLPSDLDGSNLPPAGTPNYFSNWQNAALPPDDGMNIWEFHVDWTNTANSTFGLSSFPNETVASMDVDPSLGNIPQPGGFPLASLAPRLMFRLAYRYQNGDEILVASHSVDANSANLGGVHWMEMRKSGGPWSMYQEGVYAPDSDNRWMGSAAMDQKGNIAVGYSVSSQNVYPSIRYAGRLAGDPLGELTQNETELIAGSGYQETTAGRWGDYSSMTIDPTDDCTFWYTQEYYELIGERVWQTRIGSFAFPSCLGNTGLLSGAVTDSSNSQAIEGAHLMATAPMTHTADATSDDAGDYSIYLGTGSYDVSATAYGYLTSVVNNVAILSGTITVQDFALTPAALYVVEGTVSDSITDGPLYAHITIEGDPSSPPAPFNDFWTDPLTGFYSVDLAEGNTYTFHVEADAPGYFDESRQVGPLTTDTVEDFALDPNLDLCTAPGYNQTITYFEDFEASDGGYTAGPGEWEWGIPTWPPGITPVPSGVNVWATDLDFSADDEIPGGAHILTATVLAIPANGGILQWWDYYGAGDAADYREIFVDGVSVWDDGQLDTNQKYWKKQYVDVSAWAGQNVLVEFYLNVAGSNPGPQGWYFDDVTIAVAGTCTPESYIYLPLILSNANP